MVSAMVVSEVPRSGSPDDTSAGRPSEPDPATDATDNPEDVGDARIVARIDQRVDALSDYLINTRIDALLAKRISDGADPLLNRLGIDLSDARIDALIERRVGDRLDFRIDWRVDARIVTLNEGLASGATDALVQARVAGYLHRQWPTQTSRRPSQAVRSRPPTGRLARRRSGPCNCRC
jgi:hypothetical protein